MDSFNGPARSQRMKVGGPRAILLVVQPEPLLARMAEVVRSMETLKLVGAFSSVAQTVDWLVWNRQAWHYAFVDLALAEEADNALAQRLVGQPRGGQVVAVVDHLWRETRQKCSALGMSDLLEKGDVIAFRSYLEVKVA